MKFATTVVPFLAVVALGSALSACKGNFEPADETAVNDGNAVDVIASGGRRLSVSGRTFAKTGADVSARQPMGGVSIFAIVNGISYQVYSGEANGGFALRDVPMRPSRDGDDTADYGTVVLYVEKIGWLYDADPITAGIQNWISIQVDAHQEDAQGNFHIDLGPLILEQDALKVTSSLVKSNAINDKWWPSNSVIGALPAERGEVYARESDASISLTFNMPMDTTYNVNFAELFDTTGVARPFIGSWDSTGTVYTMTPTTALTADNNDTRQYQLRIARPVRAFNSWSGTRHELENVSFQFDVLKSGRDTLLAAVVPTTFAPGEGNVGYFFDANRVLRTGYIGGGVTTVDVVDVISPTMCIRFSQNINARKVDGYRIYARNPDVDNGMWKDTTVEWTTLRLLGDGTVQACTPDIYGAAFTNDGVFTYGEQIQLIATPVDNDGNEGPISAVGTPLTISDNWQPSVTAGSYSKEYTPNEPDEYMSASPTGLLTMTFSEAMDPWAAVSTGSVTSVSGLISSVTASSFRLSNANWTQARAQITPTFRVYDQTLARPAKTGDTTIYVTNVVGLMKGFRLLIYDSLSGINSGAVTISHIRSSENAVVLSAALGANINFPAGAAVRLLEGVPNLTYFAAQLTAAANPPTQTVSVDNPSRFYPGQSLVLHHVNEEGTVNSGAYVVQEVGTTTLTFTTGITHPAPVGAYLVDDTVPFAEPEPRAAAVADFQPTQPLRWNGGTATTTLSIDNWGAGDDAQTTVILVGSGADFRTDDLIKIAGSTASGVLATKAVAADTSLSITGHPFKKNDIIRIEPPSIRVAVAANIATGDTTATLAQAVSAVSGETNFMITDPQFTTELTVAADAGDTTFTVASTMGLAPGQSITINSGVEAAETRTIGSITGSDVTVTVALTNNHGVGARVLRAAIGPDAHSITADSAGVTLAISAAADDYSRTAVITKTRNHLEWTLAVAPPDANTVTLPAAIAATNYFPVGTTVRLVSADEWRRVAAVNGNVLTLNAALNFPHRQGVAVTKPSQFSMIANAADMSDFMIGDTVVCDTLLDEVDAHNDRFEGTVVDFDTAAGFATFTTTKTSMVDTGALKCRHLGDAVRIQGVFDINGQSVRTTWGNKLSLEATSVAY